MTKLEKFKEALKAKKENLKNRTRGEVNIKNAIGVYKNGIKLLDKEQREKYIGKQVYIRITTDGIHIVKVPDAVIQGEIKRRQEKDPSYTEKDSKGRERKFGKIGYKQLHTVSESGFIRFRKYDFEENKKRGENNNLIEFLNTIAAIDTGKDINVIGNNVVKFEVTENKLKVKFKSGEYLRDENGEIVTGSVTTDLSKFEHALSDETKTFTYNRYATLKFDCTALRIKGVYDEEKIGEEKEDLEKAIKEDAEIEDSITDTDLEEDIDDEENEENEEDEELNEFDKAFV